MPAPCPAPASGAAAVARQSAPAPSGAAWLVGTNIGGGAAYPGGTVPVSSHSSHCAAVATAAASAGSAVAVAAGIGAGAGAVAAPGRRGSTSYDLAGYAPACLVCRYCSYSDVVDGASSRILPVRGKAGRLAARDGRGVRRTYDAGARTAASNMLLAVLWLCSLCLGKQPRSTCNRLFWRLQRRGVCGCKIAKDVVPYAVSAPTPPYGRAPCPAACFRFWKT